MFRAFDTSFAEAVEFVTDDIQRGFSLVKEKGVIRAVGDEIKLGVEMGVEALESVALAGCAAPCRPPEKVQLAPTCQEETNHIRPADLARRFVAVTSKDPGNAFCFDCGSSDVEAADLSFSILLCNKCSQSHMNPPMAAHVRHCKRDVWSEPLLKVVENGGNSLLLGFMQANHIPKDARNCYFTDAVAWYREAWLRCHIASWPPPIPPPGVIAPLVQNTPSQEVRTLDERNVQATSSQVSNAKKSPSKNLDLGTADLLSFDNGSDVRKACWDEEDLMEFDAVEAHELDAFAGVSEESAKKIQGYANFHLKPPPAPTTSALAPAHTVEDTELFE